MCVSPFVICISLGVIVICQTPQVDYFYSRYQYYYCMNNEYTPHYSKGLAHYTRNYIPLHLSLRVLRLCYPWSCPLRFGFYTRGSLARITATTALRASPVFSKWKILLYRSLKRLPARCVITYIKHYSAPLNTTRVPCSPSVSVPSGSYMVMKPLQ